jgi:hypothetical protein
MGDARLRSRQSLKGASAIRTIPLHPHLVAAGFLHYVADVRATGRTKRFFPHLASGTTKAGAAKTRYSQGVVAQFSAYLREL